MQDQFESIAYEYGKLKDQALDMIKNICYNHITNKYKSPMSDEFMLVLVNSRGYTFPTDLGVGLNLKGLSIAECLTYYNPKLIEMILTGGADRFTIIEELNLLIESYKRYYKKFSKDTIIVTTTPSMNAQVPVTAREVLKKLKKSKKL